MENGAPHAQALPHSAPGTLSTVCYGCSIEASNAISQVQVRALPPSYFTTNGSAYCDPAPFQKVSGKAAADCRLFDGVQQAVHEIDHNSAFCRGWPFSPLPLCYRLGSTQAWHGCLFAPHHAILCVGTPFAHVGRPVDQQQTPTWGSFCGDAGLKLRTTECLIPRMQVRHRPHARTSGRRLTGLSITRHACPWGGSKRCCSAATLGHKVPLQTWDGSWRLFL